MPHTLTLRGISQIYKNRPVLREICLEGFNQKFLSLVGPAGSGKSTLLRLMAGIESPSEGEIFFDGGGRPQRLWDQGKIEFLGFDVDPSWSVEKFLKRGIRKSSVPNFQKDKKIQEVAREFYIASSLSQKLFQLSTSELYRVLFAKAFHSGAQILILDGALSFLDAEDRQFMISKLLDFKKQPHTMIIYASHDFEDVAPYADEVLILRSGLLEQQGSPQEIYEAPATLFSAHMTGKSKFNRLECSLRQDLSGSWYLDLEQNQKIPFFCRGGDFSFRHLYLGIRPHHLSWGLKKEVHLQGVVTGFQVLAGQGYLLLSLKEDTIFHIPYETSPGEPLPSLGEVRPFSFNLQNCFLFDDQGAALRFHASAA